MSHKGAIRKISSTRDGQQTNVKSKPKSLLSNKDSGDSEQIDVKLMRTSQTIERVKDKDGNSNLSQNVQLNKNTTKYSTRPLKNPSAKENSNTISKFHINSTRTLSKNVLTSKSSTDFIKKSSINNVVKNTKSSTGRVQSNYTEKRGQSSIFVPQSLTSKLNTKLATKNPVPISKNEGQVRTRSSKSETAETARQRRLSRTLSPSEVKMLHSAVNEKKLSQNPESSGPVQVEPQQVDNECNYEDDFEDYESDFQECTDSDASEVLEETSTVYNDLHSDPIELQTAKQSNIVNVAEKKEEEHMHDSGHYELTEARKRAARMDSIINDPKLASFLEIRQPVNKSYSEEKSDNKSLPLSTDEGFEDSRSGEFAKSPPVSQTTFIEFRPVKKQEPEETKKPKILTRGEELLGMIKLDVMEWSLLECSPIPYEEFIRSYGKLNAQQMSTQTGEDNIDTETQTEEIMSCNKWTQFPISCRTNLKTKKDLRLFQMDQVGVGDDSSVETMTSLFSSSFDILRLNDFMNRAGRVMLCLLEERQCGSNGFKKEETLSFSDGITKLSVDSITFLSGRAVIIIHYSDVLNKILLTIHCPVEEEIETSSKQDYITDCCIGCVWNISEPSMPVKLFYSTTLITSCCFHSTNYNVVFAGLEDGSISIWDLKEDEMWHHKVLDSGDKHDWTIRMPTYTTASNIETTDTSPIVSIRILSKIEDKSFERLNNKFVPIQICSLNENGSLVIWSVLHKMGRNINDVGLSSWGKIKLVKNQELRLQSHNQKRRTDLTLFIDMHVDSITNNNLYIITNSPNILHATCIGNKANPAVYTNMDNSICGNVTCIDVCPFEKSLFLVGCSDGTIRLHSINTEKPILQFRDEINKYIIKAIQWSRSKAFTIYTLDCNSCIHIWDLSNSNIHPIHTINMQQNGCITSMQLSFCKTNQDMSHQYLAFGMDSGNVEIHKLKSNLYYSKKEDYLKELDAFLRYVTIL